MASSSEESEVACYVLGKCISHPLFSENLSHLFCSRGFSIPPARELCSNSQCVFEGMSCSASSSDAAGTPQIVILIYCRQLSLVCFLFRCCHKPHWWRSSLSIKQDMNPVRHMQCLDYQPSMLTRPIISQLIDAFHVAAVLVNTLGNGSAYEALWTKLNKTLLQMKLERERTLYAIWSMKQSLCNVMRSLSLSPGVSVISFYQGRMSPQMPSKVHMTFHLSECH